MDLKLNFMGIIAADWTAAYQFYRNTLGLQTHLNPRYGDQWAALGGDWEMYHAGIKGVVMELFDLGTPANHERRWGKGQGVRPAIQVDDLEAAVETLRARGISFNGEIEETLWGRRIEFSGAEGFHWSLSQVAEKPFSTDLSKPFIGHFEIKAHDFERQKNFYGDLLQMRLEAEGDSYAILGQGDGEPWIVLETGGEVQQIDVNWADKPTRSQPLFMSFMTSDAEASARHLRASGVPLLKEVKHYPDWGGTEFVITDADGNVLQIVQYDHF